MAKSLGRVKKDDSGILRGAVFGCAGINILSDPTSIAVESGQCVAIVNCDIDDEHNATRREGSIKVGTAIIAAAKTIRGVVYCVSGGYLCTFNGTAATPLTTDFTVLDTCEFEDVNAAVVFSDTAKIGIIEGSVVTRIDTSADWVDVTALETWVASHAPADPAQWNGTTSNSNFEVDTFKLSTLSGKCLESYNGALYMAIDNFVYMTKTHDVAGAQVGAR